jgi:hypothetical protein
MSDSQTLVICVWPFDSTDTDSARRTGRKSRDHDRASGTSGALDGFEAYP